MKKKSNKGKRKVIRYRGLQILLGRKAKQMRCMKSKITGKKHEADVCLRSLTITAIITENKFGEKIFMTQQRAALEKFFFFLCACSDEIWVSRAERQMRMWAAHTEYEIRFSKNITLKKKKENSFVSLTGWIGGWRGKFFFYNMWNKKFRFDKKVT